MSLWMPLHTGKASSSVIGTAEFPFHLPDRFLQGKPDKMLGPEVAAGFFIVREHTGHDAGNGALRGVGGLGTAQVRAAPAWIGQVDHDVGAFHFGAHVDGDLVQGGLAGGIARLLGFQADAAGGIQDAAFFGMYR